ncbi:putative lipid A disaccharide synthase [Candidatus Protochlamydia naegleriophila]|uniref:Lipid-A-disaccharide synthase n=1 Tax=Candidatus Protochlamydia naegleriophila TaxID=389348 RepID=A0A0U5JBV7_9BACT|nr:lipid-A-disaccharide synthase [Candidatus Protochlamydia naegleriophila]CUI16178.1 putative lipid A disaccharide synthase [Candidatus Protochlamydia naegleriophila]
MRKDCFIFAGESSGDLHGSRLLKALKNGPTFNSFRGIGGPLMRQEGLECLFKMESFQVMGFSDVIKALPSLWKHFYAIRNHILDTKPTCTILIDYPGFNLRLAKALRKGGYQGKIVQYICPTVWAHGKKRIEAMVSSLDLLLTIYPFESDLFAKTSLKATYIGNPLVETVQKHAYQPHWKQVLNIPEEQQLIAIFPGSRLGEIQRHTQHQLQVAYKLKEKYPSLGFAISCAHDDLYPILQEQIKKTPLEQGKDIHLVPRAYSYELMKECSMALAKSGTVTLELALHRKPSVVLYTLTALNYYIAKYWMRLNLPHYCIVNILGKKEIFPELIGRELDCDRLYENLDALLQKNSLYTSIEKECASIQQQLGTHSASSQASQAIQELFQC